MLDASVGVKKACAYCTDFWPEGMTHHRFQPVWSDDFNVIVEEGDEGPRTVRGTKVLKRGVVKGFWVGQDANSRILREKLQEGEGDGIGRLIIQNQEFPAWVGGEVFDALDAGIEEGRLIPSGDENGDKRRRRGQWP